MNKTPASHLHRLYARSEKSLLKFCKGCEWACRITRAHVKEKQYNMKMKGIITALALGGFVTSTPLLLAADHNHGNHAPAGGSAGGKHYPLTTCVVSGEKLGEMGAPYVHKHNGREVRFCCKGCLKDFNKDPNKYLKALTNAEKKGH